MSIHGQRLSAGQQVIVTIGVSPTGLQAAQLWILKLWYGSFEPVRRGNKIGVKDGDEFAAGSFQSLFQRAGFIAASFGAEDTFDIEAACAIFFHETRGEQRGIIG